jgi:DNA-nicking Smr family endonuclease
MADPPRPGDGEDDEEEWEPEPVVLEITDVLDLHSFPPREVGDLVRDYLDAAWERGLTRVRLIHGKGRGVQRQQVREILERDPRVTGFGDMPLEAGSWGATWVALRDPRVELRDPADREP